MCTVTFFPTESGYVVAMNRDDIFSRAQTVQPSAVLTGRRSAVFPAEIGGGTWIGTNDAGLTFCLLNWNRPGGTRLRSRGEVIPQLLALDSLREVDDSLTSDLLNGRLPFRLVGISLNENAVSEWRWDGFEAEPAMPFPWERSHWFSAGMSDDEARRQRLAVCHDALAQEDALSIEWLRRLHRSHVPVRGPFSICAHRSEAGTLSYTEVVVSQGRSEIRYTDASPCLEHPLYSVRLRINAATQAIKL